MTRVSSGTLTVVVFAILAGLMGAYVVRQRLAQPQPTLGPLEAGPNDIVVPVAATDLQPGQMLTINDIALVKMSPENFAKSQYVKQSYMRNTEQIAQRVLKGQVKRGEAFVTDSFYPDGAGPGIAEMLEAGYRAVTIPIEHISAVQGFARPGTFVDVLFRSRAEEERPEVTITLLEKVKVLAVNKNTLSEQSVELDKGGTVTMAVTPIQAKALKVVEGRGELSLTLRNPDDDLDFLPVDLHQGEGMRGIAGGRVPRDGQLHPVKNVHLADAGEEFPWWMGMERVTQGTDQISLDDVLNIPPKPKPARMQIYRGSQKEVVTFDDGPYSSSVPPSQMIHVPAERSFVRDQSSDPNSSGSKVRTVQFGNVPVHIGG